MNYFYHVRCFFIKISATALFGASLCTNGAMAAGPNSDVPVVNSNATVATSSTITLLGTMGGPPLDIHSKRAENSTLLTVGKRQYLIDAGTGVTRRLMEYGLPPHKIHQIFITHNHFDHTAGLTSLLAESWFNGWFYHDTLYMDKSSLKPFTTIYGPPDTKTVFEGIMQYMSVSARIFNTDDTGAGTIKSLDKVFDVHTVEAHEKPVTFYDDGTVKVTAVENTHYGIPTPESLRETGDLSYAYRFDTPAGGIVFTGDTGPSECVTNLAKGADVLVSEVLDFDLLMDPKASSEGGGVSKAPNVERIRNHMLTEHLSPEEVGKMAQKAGVKTVLLYHIVPGDAPLEYARNFAAGVKKYFRGTVIVGHDFSQYTLLKE